MNPVNFLGAIDSVARNSGARLARRKQFLDVIFMWGQSEFAGRTDNTGGYAYLDAIGWNGSLLNDGATTSPGQSPGMAIMSRGISLPGVFVSQQTDPATILPFNPHLLDMQFPTQLANTAIPLRESFETGLFVELFKRQQALESDWMLINCSLAGQSLSQLAAMSTPPKSIPSQFMSAADANLTTREKMLKQLWCAKLFAEQRGQELRLIAGIRGQGAADIGNASFGAQVYAEFQTLDTWCRTYLGTNVLFWMQTQTGKSNTATQLDSNYDTASSGVAVPIDTQVLLQARTARAAGFPMYALGPLYPFGQRLHPYSLHHWASMFGDRIAKLLWEGWDGELLTFAWTRNGAAAIRGVPNMPVALVARSGMGILGNLQNGFATNSYGIVPQLASGGHITGVTLTTSTQVDVTFSGNVVAGDIISMTGNGARYSNFREVTEKLGTLLDQNPYSPLDGSGNMEFHLDTTGGQPVKAVDISQWAASDRAVLA